MIPDASQQNIELALNSSIELLWLEFFPSIQPLLRSVLGKFLKSRLLSLFAPPYRENTPPLLESLT